MRAWGAGGLGGAWALTVAALRGCLHCLLMDGIWGFRAKELPGMPPRALNGITITELGKPEEQEDSGSG